MMTSPRAFTLIELLVVISIIALLIALLLPALSLAKKTTMKVQCASNLKQVGAAIGGYYGDHDGFLPHHPDWGNMLGKIGTGPNRLRYDHGHGSAGSGFPGDRTASGQPVTIIRPLNKYLTSPEAAHCPDDRGDTWLGIGQPTDNNYEEYGNSYLPQWNSDMFGAMRSTGSKDPRDDGPGIAPINIDAGSLKAVSAMTAAAGSVSGSMGTKLIMADWNWHMNRPMSNPHTQWHLPGGTRRFNTLFGDGHAMYFDFGSEFEGAHHTIRFIPDPGRGWW